MKDFEMNGHKYVCVGQDKIRDIKGSWWSQYEWNKDKQEFVEKSKLFFPIRGGSRITRKDIEQSFKYGTHIVYLQMAYNRLERAVIERLVNICNGGAVKEKVMESN